MGDINASNFKKWFRRETRKASRRGEEVELREGRIGKT